MRSTECRDAADSSSASFNDVSDHNSLCDRSGTHSNYNSNNDVNNDYSGDCNSNSDPKGSSVRIDDEHNISCSSCNVSISNRENSLRILDIFCQYTNISERDSVSRSISEYLSYTKPCAREILDFRLNMLTFLRFIDYLRDIVSMVKEKLLHDKALDGHNDCLHLKNVLVLLLFLVKDSDFSLQLGVSGGHAQLKNLQRIQDLLPSPVSELVDEIVASIIDGGVMFPLATKPSSDEAVITPLEFRVKVDLEYQSTTNNLDYGDISVIIRQITNGLHGSGQEAVGYIMWSSAVILSRWLALNAAIFRNIKVLEIGAGNGLCGITAACFADSVTLSDFNIVVLDNIEKSIKLNTGSYKMSCFSQSSQGCLGGSSEHVKVCHFDWNKLLPNSGRLETPSSIPISTVHAASTKFCELVDPKSSSTERYNIIIASDVVCCDSDASAVAHTLTSFLIPSANIPCPLAIILVPSEFHRYGVKNLIPMILKVGLVVHQRYIISSQFDNDAYTRNDEDSPDCVKCNGCKMCEKLGVVNDGPDICDKCALIDFNGIKILKSFHNHLNDDYLTHDLQEAQICKWLFLIVHRQHELDCDNHPMS